MNTMKYNPPTEGFEEREQELLSKLRKDVQGLCPPWYLGQPQPNATPKQWWLYTNVLTRDLPRELAAVPIDGKGVPDALAWIIFGKHAINLGKRDMAGMLQFLVEPDGKQGWRLREEAIRRIEELCYMTNHFPMLVNKFAEIGKWIAISSVHEDTIRGWLAGEFSLPELTKMLARASARAGGF